VQELLCPKQTQSLGPLVPIDGSASQVHILTETPGHNCVFGPPAVTESSAVEDSLDFASNNSEATTPVVSCTEEQTGAYSNLDLGSSIIITTDINETGAPYPVTSSVTGDPVASLGTCEMSLGSNAETNVTTPVAGTELGVWTGQWASSSYENAAVNVCEETSCVENRNRQSCCYEQRKLPGLEDRQSCCHEQRKLPDMENQNDCCAARRGSIASRDGMLLLEPTVSVENQCDCCAARSGSISSEDGMSSLGPAVSVSAENVEREVCELPVNSTAETGYKVDQSDSQRPSSSVAVFLCPHPALASSSKARQDTDELPFHQQEIALNDTESSIVQHDDTDCKRFEGAVEQGLSVPRNEVSSDGVCNESVENLTSANREEILYTDTTPARLPQGGIQPDDTPRRPARAAARPSRFRDDQFETKFCPGPRKNKVQQVHFDPRKGESMAVEKKQPHTEQKTPERQGCQILGKGESNGTTLGNSKQVGPTNNSSIQFPSDHHHLLRKNGRRFGWLTWSKIRFKSHAQSRWKF